MKRLQIRPIVAVAALTILALITIAVSTAVLVWDLRQKEFVHARGETVSLSHILAEQTTRTVQSVNLAMQNVQASLAESEARGEPLNHYEIYELLRNRASGMPQIRSLFIVDAQGITSSSARNFPAPAYRVGDREYFTWHSEQHGRGLYIGTPTRGRTDNQWTLHMSRRLEDAAGHFRGVMVASLNLGYFGSLYESIAFDGIGPISLFLEDGTLIAGQPHEGAVIGERITEAHVAFGNSDERTIREITPAKERRIATYHRAAQFPLVISVAIGEDEVQANWWAKVRYIVFGAILVAILIAAAGSALARGLAKEEALTSDLRETGQRLQATIDAAMDAIVIVDDRQRVVLFNPAAERMFGCTAEAAIGSPLERFIPQRYRDAHHSHVENFGTSTTPARVMAPQMEVIGLRLDGSEFPIESTISHVKVHGETLYTAILRDVTERRQAQSQLIESNRQLRELSGALQHVREEERTRIARELHDELGQQLTGLKINLNWLARQVENGKWAGKIDGMKEELNATIRSVRRIATELRPTMLDDLGLGPAMQWLADDFALRTGIAVTVDLAGQDLAQGDEIVTALFRITQECLTNIAKHAGATAASLWLRQDGATLELGIADNGIGMAEGRGKGGFGLVGIRERALMIGASATISSQPGDGTVVRIAVPLAAETAKTESLS